jgi:hypothetical protein
MNMSPSDQSDCIPAKSEEQKAEWSTPAIRALEAREAKNGDGSGPDGGFIS